MSAVFYQELYMADVPPLDVIQGAKMTKKR